MLGSIRRSSTTLLVMPYRLFSWPVIQVLERDIPYSELFVYLSYGAFKIAMTISFGRLCNLFRIDLLGFRQEFSPSRTL